MLTDEHSVGRIFARPPRIKIIRWQKYIIVFVRSKYNAISKLTPQVAYRVAPELASQPTPQLAPEPTFLPVSVPASEPTAEPTFYAFPVPNTYANYKASPGPTPDTAPYTV